MKSPYDNPKILILEDDPDQMAFLIDATKAEVTEYVENESPNSQQLRSLNNIQLIKVSNVGSLNKAVSIHKDVILAILDCNTPDSIDGKPHDQLIKTKHKITGQHRAVDIVIQQLPDTPILLTSSLNRFRKIIYQYYENNHGVDLRFIRKSNPQKLGRNIKEHLSRYLSSTA